MSAGVGQAAGGQAAGEQAAGEQAAGGQAAGGQAVLGAGDVALQAAQGADSLEGWKSREFDGAVRQLAAALAGHELKLSRLLWRFHRADGWRRLGYATETQYARERLGLSRSSVIARRSLALRLEGLPHVAMALSRAEIGVEAALQLVRIATPRTEMAWLARARQRTVKHLREEVAAALAAVRDGQRGAHCLGARRARAAVPAGGREGAAGNAVRRAAAAPDAATLLP